MKELKIKVDISNGKILPQIEFGPYNSSDIIAKTIVSVLDYNMLQRLVDEGRIEVINEDHEKAILIYKYN